MRIQTEREREPTLRNIERDAPETKVDTEVFENSYGVKTARESGIQTQEDAEDDETDEEGTAPVIPVEKKDTSQDNAPEPDADSDSDSGGTGRTTKAPDRKGKMPPADQHKRKKYTIASLDSGGSDVIEESQAVADAADAVIQTGSVIRTAVRTSSDGIGKIHPYPLRMGR